MVQARDPWTTASIILALLLLHNIVLAVTHVATSLLFGDTVNPIDRVWDYRGYQFRSIPGYKTALVQLITVVLCIPIQVVLVQRAKLILDFAMTVQFSQLLFTWLYSNHFPTSWAWWFTWLVSSIVLVFGGEFACMRIELQPLVFGSSAAPTLTAGSEGIDAQAEQNVGLARTSHGEEIEMEERDKSLEEGRVGKP